MSCCGGKNFDDSTDCYTTANPSEDCMEIPLTAGSSAHKTFSLPCLKSRSRVSLAEKDFDSLQLAFFALTSHFAKIQFRLRQIMQARPSERDDLLFDLAAVAFCGVDEFKCNGLPRMEKDFDCLGTIRRRQVELIQRLRGQMDELSNKTVPLEPDKDTEDENQTDSKKDKKKQQKNEKPKTEVGNKQEKEKNKTPHSSRDSFQKLKEKTKSVAKRLSNTEMTTQKQKKKHVHTSEESFKELKEESKTEVDKQKSENKIDQQNQKNKTPQTSQESLTNSKKETKTLFDKKKSKNKNEQQKDKYKTPSKESLQEDSAGELDFMLKKGYIQ